MAGVWKRRDRDVWVVDYRNATGKRIRLTASTRKDADDLLAQKGVETKEDDAIVAPYKDHTVAQYVPKYGR
jgi:hypothetical protein